MVCYGIFCSGQKFFDSIVWQFLEENNIDISIITRWVEGLHIRISAFLLFCAISKMKIL